MPIDAAAFLPLAQRIARHVHRQATERYGLPTRRLDVEEMTAAALYGVARSAPRFDAARGVPPAGYLGKVIVGYCRNSVAQQLGLRRATAVEQLAHDVIDHRPADGDNAAVEQVGRLLARLDGDARTVLVEHFIKGRTLQAIGLQRGRSRQAIHRRVQTALATLRKEVRPAPDGIAADWLEERGHVEQAETLRRTMATAEK